MADQYGVFQEDRKGPMWRGFFADLENAKTTAQKLADDDRVVFFIYCFKRYIEVGRFRPTERRLVPRP
jgi:hypothetical protein